MSADPLPNLRHTSDSDSWQSPGLVLDPARVMLGGFDLDPCSSFEANKRVGATRFFDAADNGFLLPWGTPAAPVDVWMNPPGGKCDQEGIRVLKLSKGAPLTREDGSPPVGASQSAAKAWWFKLAREFAEGHVRRAVVLGFSLELLQTAQAVPRRKAGDPNAGLLRPTQCPICIPSSRIPFIDGLTGEEVQGNTHASVIVFVTKGRHPGILSIFEEHFSSVGDCMMGRMHEAA